MKIKIRNGSKRFILVILLLFISLSLISAYDSGWQSWRTKSDYVVCGGFYKSCSNNLLGLNNHWSRGWGNYGIICGGSRFPYGCTLHGGNSNPNMYSLGSGIGKLFLLNTGDYYLMIKNIHKDSNERFIAGLSNSYGANGKDSSGPGTNFTDYTTTICVFRETFSGGLSSKVWFRATGGSMDSAQFRLTTCISEEDISAGLVYCDDWSSNITANCPIVCTSNVTFTNWSVWTNQQCINFTHANQSRFRIEYDANGCGFVNVTHWEYQPIEDESCSDSQNDSLYIIINSPENRNYTNNLILINISTNGTSTWYNWNGTNISYSSPLINFFPDGQHTLSAWANNTFGDLVYYNVTFYVNTIGNETDSNQTNQTGLILTIHSPINNSVYTTSTILLNVTADKQVVYWFYSLNGNSSCMYNTSSANFTTNLLNLSNRNYTLQVCGAINSSFQNCSYVNFQVNLPKNEDEGDNSGSKDKCIACFEPLFEGEDMVSLGNKTKTDLISLYKQINQEEATGNLSSWFLILLLLIAILFILFVLLKL